jgi:predicted ATP-dependent endonuclease of OLD family
MRLEEVVITNFRSIESLTIKFNPKCKILVGINESGKSNILEALSMLSADRNPTKHDRRIGLPDEPPIENSYIHFIFALENYETSHVVEEIQKRILSKDKKAPLLASASQEHTIEQFCSSRKGLYRVDIIQENKNVSYWGLPDGWKVPDNWKKPSPACPADFLLEIKDGSSLVLNDYNFINTDDFNDIPKEYLSKVAPVEVNHMVAQYLMDFVRERIPDTVFWRYIDENLLPAHINLAEFASNPAICKPLQYMFELAQIVNIQEKIDEARNTSPHSLRNLLDRVSKITTEHFHNTWKEYKKIKFELMPNGGLIDITIKDEFNHYELSKRSDGFKRFITFLLMISVRVKTGKLQDAIIIIDEPDMSLHPSGTRYLRDELIRISEKNIVVFSTHSIFMVDKENIGRHYIVKKENEKTSISTVDESNIIDEEVLYNALGYSVFENLKQQNLLFEGWRDKELFKVAMGRVPKKYGHLKKVFDSIGMCHAKGVKDFRNITPLIELANRDCLILSDDDKPAKDKQGEYRRDKGYGVWMRYSEIQPEVEAITGEDFIIAKAFSKSIASLRREYFYLPELTGQKLNSSKGRIHAIRSWLIQGGIEQDKLREILNSIKDDIFDNLKSSHIEQKYYDFLSKLADYISKMKSVAP